jgi:hypothetical protein
MSRYKTIDVEALVGCLNVIDTYLSATDEYMVKKKNDLAHVTLLETVSMIGVLIATFKEKENACS